ncbi:MAG TPA: VWA domain-containing protein [Paludibacteraceae bacterium]|nr:VWA domain-containing protein [Paludibacteraceae bacterium]
MFRFANPQLLYLLIVVPFLVGLFLYSQLVRKQRLEAFGNLELLKQLMPDVSAVRPQVKFYLLMLVYVLIVFGLARPQFGSKLETSQRKGIEAILAVDVSNSMMAEDVSPNRLERTKMMLSKLIDEMVDDKLGIIVFAGDAFVQLPITTDNVSAKMFLSSITPKLVQRQGTAIGSAIDLAIKAFGRKESDAGRAIIVLTDGENHEDDAVEMAKLASEKNIVVHVIGVGSPNGAPIPETGTMSFKKDKEGNVVVSRLNEKMCQDIASAGKGIYARADNSNVAVKALTKEIRKMQQGNLEAKVYSQYDERFFVFAWIALFFLIVEFFILIRQNQRMNKIKLFNR